MNKKYAIATIVLIASMSLSLIPIGAHAWQTGPAPSGPSDTTYGMFGPVASQLIMNVYGSYAPTFAALQTGAIDYMDGNLLPTDYSAIKNNPVFTTGAVTAFGLREFDMNCIVAPFNSTYFRQGLASLIDRNQFLSTYFPSGGLPAYSVLQAMGSWADPAMGPPAYYPQDFATAYLDFCLAYGAPVPDPLRPGYSTWNFPNSYPTAASNPNPTPYDGSGPGIGQNQILFYIRTEQLERQNSGVYLVDQAENQLPLWAQANQGDPVFTSYPLPVVGGVKQWPALNFYNHGILTTSATTSVQVMTYYRFQLYTGGWITGSTPDFMEVWLSAYAPQNTGWGPFAYNSGSFMDSQFDTYEQNMENAAVIDPYTTVGTARYYAYKAQERLAALCGVIPWWIYSGFSGTLTSTAHSINALGVGFGNWYSFLNAYPTAGSPGYGSNALYWGWESDMHTNANPVSSTWAWDWYLIGQVYDSLVSLNPYDTSDFHPGLADNYTVAIDPVTHNTVLTVHLRENIFWQDVPYKDRSAYTMDGGHELDGPFQNVPLTPLDVAFTEIMARDFNFYEPVHINPNAADVDHVVISSIYNNPGGWPWTVPGVDPPWWNSTFMLAHKGVGWDDGFVQFDSSLDSETIKICLSVPKTWLAYYVELGIPVYPLHIFEYLAEGPWMHNGHAVPDVCAMNMGPLGGANLEYGTGPWIWTGGSAGFQYILTAYKEGVSYGGITEQNSYFWSPIREADAMTLGSEPETTYWKQGTHTLYEGATMTNYDPTHAYTFTAEATITYWRYTSGTWSGPYTATSAVDTYTVAAGGSVSIWEPVSLTLPTGTTFIAISEYFHFVIVAGSGAFASPAWAVGISYYDGDFLPLRQLVPMWSDNDYPLYGSTETPELINVSHPAGDNAGSTLVEPYGYGCDHIINLLDLNTISLNWQPPKNTVSWAPGTYNPLDARHRGDINGDGIINLLDLNYISLNWQPPKNSWTDAAPSLAGLPAMGP